MNTVRNCRNASGSESFRRRMIWKSQMLIAGGLILGGMQLIL